jgi:surface protein
MTTIAFVTKWRVIGEDKTLILPLWPTGEYDFYVDWGDGTQDHITTCTASHSYSSQGTYQVSIKGLIKGWRATNKPGFRLLDVCQWGCLKLGNEGYYFEGCTEIDISATDAPDLSETTNLSGMFGRCSKFNGKIEHWNVSSVTNMQLMFWDASSFNQDLSGWDVSSVTNMQTMFTNASSFNQPIGEWDVSSVRSMEWMFCGASSFNQSISGWDVSSVIDMMHMFHGASSFNQPIGGWDVSNVITMQSMFREASSFNQDISMWNVSMVYDMANMFLAATAFINGAHLRELETWNVSGPGVTANLMGDGKGIHFRPKCLLLTWAEWVKDHPNAKQNIEYTCPICITDLVPDESWRAFTCPATVKEGIPHCFHHECIEQWIEANSTCPVCRRAAMSIQDNS